MLVARYRYKKDLAASVGQPLRHTETSIVGDEYTANGVIGVVGPSAYTRRWYAVVTMFHGRIKRVK